MSESGIALFVKFDDYDKLEVVEDILKDIDKLISESGDEITIHDYLQKKNLTMGVQFDSWWIPETIMTNGCAIIFKLIGSPSGTREEDIVTWLNKMGATSISGNLLMSGGGDVEEMDI
ncbi:hypothetical protein [Desulforhopalus sp. 52FAK]